MRKEEKPNTLKITNKKKKKKKKRNAIPKHLGMK